MGVGEELKDREVSASLVKGAEAAGCQELPKNVASFASLFDATLTWERH